MIVVQTNLELLLSDNVLLGPILVIFPNAQSENSRARPKETSLYDFARLYYPLDLLHDERSNPH